MRDVSLEEALKSAAERTEKELACRLSPGYSGHTLLREAMCYATLGGGKRIRAFLVLETARMFGAAAETALPFAAAIEMVHAYSLVHDDLPCMDNDDLRRGKPSCHKRFGEANALLAGDTLLTQAFEVLVSSPASDRSKCAAVATLSRCAGALGMAGGQYLDLSESCDSLESLMYLESLKTGALIRASVHLGYLAAEGKDAAVLSDLTAYAEGIGVSFQIVDDLLDVYGDAATLGKSTGSDAKNDKKTVLTFLTPDEAKALAEEQTEQAIEAIRRYPDSETLIDLALWLLTRRK